MNEDFFSSIYNQALDVISRREHSEKEIKNKLLKKFDNAELVDEVIVVSHSEAAHSLRVLARDSHLVVEGAGAVAHAAAMRSKFSGKNIVSVISGGNIDFSTYSRILNGDDF